MNALTQYVRCPHHESPDTRLCEPCAWLHAELVESDRLARQDELVDHRAQRQFLRDLRLWANDADPDYAATLRVAARQLEESCLPIPPHRRRSGSPGWTR